MSYRIVILLFLLLLPTLLLVILQCFSNSLSFFLSCYFLLLPLLLPSPSLHTLFLPVLSSLHILYLCQSLYSITSSPSYLRSLFLLTFCYPAVDDMVDTAGTLCKAAEVLKEFGARRVFAFASHGVFSGQSAFLPNIGYSRTSFFLRFFFICFHFTDFCLHFLLNLLPLSSLLLCTINRRISCSEVFLFRVNIRYQCIMLPICFILLLPCDHDCF